MKLTTILILTGALSSVACVKRNQGSKTELTINDTQYPEDLGQPTEDVMEHPANQNVLGDRFDRSVGFPPDIQSRFSKISSQNEGQTLSFVNKIGITPFADIGLEGGIETTFAVTYERDIQVNFISTELQQNFDINNKIQFNAPYILNDTTGRPYNNYIFQCVISSKDLTLESNGRYVAGSLSVPFLDKILRGLNIKSTAVARNLSNSINTWSNSKFSPYMNMIPKNHFGDTYQGDPNLYFNLCMEWSNYKASPQEKTIRDLADESIKSYTIGSYQRVLLDSSDGFSCSPDLKQQSSCQLNHPDVITWRKNYETALIQQEMQRSDVVNAVGSINGLSASDAKSICMSYADLKLTDQSPIKANITAEDATTGVCRLRSPAYHACPVYNREGKRQLNMARFLRTSLIDKSEKNTDGSAVYPANMDFASQIKFANGHSLEETTSAITYWYQAIGPAALELQCEPQHQCLAHKFERYDEDQYAAVCVPNGKIPSFQQHWDWFDTLY